MRATGTSRTQLKRRAAAAIAAAVAAGIVLAACTATSPAGKPATPHSSGVVSLTRISTLRSVFNADGGHPRLLLIFSPT
jgi:hypothetical protein